MPSPLTYGLLVLAIAAEIFGTTMLQRSEQFSRLLPTLLMGLGYALSFYLLSHVLKSIPLGVAYAIWSGLGIVFVALVGRVVFGQHLDAAAIAGLAMIVGGVLVVNLLSDSITH